MVKGKIRIALVAVEEEDRAVYSDMLSKFEDVELEIFSTVKSFRRGCSGNIYSGVVLDIGTMAGASQSDRDFLASLSLGFPVLRVGRPDDGGVIDCVLEGIPRLDISGREVLDYFMTKKCRDKTPRQIRLKVRRNIFYNVLLFKKDGDEPSRANLWDISEGGAYVLTPLSGFKSGDTVWLGIQDLQDTTPIRGQIRWTQPWGLGVRHLPGFGISFVEISEGQKREIKNAVEDCTPPNED